MSRTPALGVAAIALVALAALPAGTAEAGFGLRGGPLGIMRSAMGRVLGLARGHHGRGYARHGGSRTAALPAQEARSAIDPARPLSSALVRAQLTSVAALAGWHGGRSRGGWWRHADGTYGWVGPLFWPFADDDLADYVVFGRGSPLLSYGYGDIHAAVFSPYAAAELAAYGSGRRRNIPALDRFCGADVSDNSALSVERIADTIQPNEAQRTALDEFASAWGSAAKIIRAHCQTAPETSGLERLGVMQGRIAAMIEALEGIAPQLQKFDAVLDAAQKQKLAALGAERPPQADRPAPQTVGAAGGAQMQGGACQTLSVAELQADPQAEQRARELMGKQWPVQQIAGQLHLTDTQSAALEVVRDTAAHILDPRDSACPPPDIDSLSDRLEAAQARLNALLETIKATSAALDDFNYNLSDEQKAAFEAMGARLGV